MIFHTTSMIFATLAQPRMVYVKKVISSQNNQYYTFSRITDSAKTAKKSYLVTTP